MKHAMKEAPTAMSNTSKTMSPTNAPTIVVTGTAEALTGLDAVGDPPEEIVPSMDVVTLVDIYVVPSVDAGPYVEAVEVVSLVDIVPSISSVNVVPSLEAVEVNSSDVGTSPLSVEVWRPVEAKEDVADSVVMSGVGSVDSGT